MKDRANLQDLNAGDLQERAREFECLYQVERILADTESNFAETVGKVADILPSGFKHHDHCCARIELEGRSYLTNGFRESDWSIKADVRVQQRNSLGNVQVFYTKKFPELDDGPFSNEEVKLIHSVARYLGSFLVHRSLSKTATHIETKEREEEMEVDRSHEWPILLNLLQRTDLESLHRISNKMMIYLVLNGVEEASDILMQIGREKKQDASRLSLGEGCGTWGEKAIDVVALSRLVFGVAEKHMTGEEILYWVQRWMKEDSSSFLSRTLINLESSLGDVADSIRRYAQLGSHGAELSESTHKGVKVALVRRFLSDQLDFIKVSREYVEIDDFHELVERIIYPSGSHGRLGGKGASLFLATRILRRKSPSHALLRNIKVPKTWYITTDGLRSFVQHNNLEELSEQKYKPLEQIEKEYPLIVQIFQHSCIPAEEIPGMFTALDDFDETPLIVRSSSLLEDRMGSLFSGIYLSLFVANQGNKQERMESLMDAICRVYASTFAAEPIENRIEKGLIDFNEEMGVMIQEVVGSPVGPYYLPVFSGIATSMGGEGGLPRQKMGEGEVQICLGCRPKDRDHQAPVFRVRLRPIIEGGFTHESIPTRMPEEIMVIDLEKREIAPVKLVDFLKEHGESLPGVNAEAPEEGEVLTQESFFGDTVFLNQIGTMMQTLHEAMGGPVEIEFASDGYDLFLLQCRQKQIAAQSQ